MFTRYGIDQCTDHYICGLPYPSSAKDSLVSVLCAEHGGIFILNCALEENRPFSQGSYLVFLSKTFFFSHKFVVNKKRTGIKV